ncbi:MAG: translation initiation factor IF-2, partial [Bacteroidaceae bacterium]|nr:translation initiation factor IF-2 [Bacteroidaceae bacterium]
MNVGVSTLVEFLHKKGFADITEDLNQKLTDEEYNLLVAEYSQDKTIREEANRFLQDRMSRKTAPEEPVQEEKPAKKEPEMVETVIPEESVIKFKTVGKIDLGKDKTEAKEEPKPEPVEPKKAEPKKAEPKPAEPVKKEPEVKVEPKKEIQPKVEPVKAEPVKVEPVVEPKVEEAPVKVAEPVAVAAPAPEPETPKEETVFKLQTPQNGGLNIKTVGKIDLTAINQSTRPKKKSKEEKKKEREAKELQRQQQRQQFKESLMKEIKPGEKSQDGDAPRKKNRVRIGGEKVDLTKADSYNQSQNNDNRGGKDAQKGGGRNNKDHRFNKADKAEFSNEDVNRQIRDTFSSFQKGKTKSSKYRKDKREQVQQRQMEALEQEMA